MNGLAKLCNGLYWLALAIWFSVLVSAGVSAMSAFTALPDDELGLRLERFAAYDETRHGQIAAGKVMEPIFTFVDVMQLTMGAIVLVTLIAQMTVFGMSWKRPANMIRIVCVVVASGLFLFRAMTIQPEMNQDLRTYWEAAKTGDVETASAAQGSFEAAHRRARPLFDATLLVLVVGIVASAAAFTVPSTTSSRSDSLEPPDLMKTNR